MELQKIEKELQIFNDFNPEVTIKNQDDLLSAGTMLKTVDDYLKKVTEKRKSITDPMRESLAVVMDMFSPYEKKFKGLKETIKKSMEDFQKAEAARIAVETERVEKRVEKGTMRTDTAVSKLEQIGTITKSAEGFSTKKVKVVKIVDKSLIPIEYMEPNMVEIRKAVLYGKGVPGCELVEEIVVAVK